LTRIGINQTTLPPGKESSMRHWHTHEDADSAAYSDPDVDLVWSPLHAPGNYTRRDGTP
jgi:hypothetical protein